MTWGEDVRDQLKKISCFDADADQMLPALNALPSINCPEFLTELVEVPVLLYFHIYATFQTTSGHGRVASCIEPRSPALAFHLTHKAARLAGLDLSCPSAIRIAIE
jgi:hypothetical protein